MHEGGGRWVGSNKLVELKKKKRIGLRVEENWKVIKLGTLKMARGNGTDKPCRDAIKKPKG